MSEDTKKTTEEAKEKEVEKKDTSVEAVKEEKTENKAEKDSSKKETKKEDEKSIPELKPGMTVRVYQKIKELNIKGEEKERIQYFEGMIIAKKHGKEIGATITMRKVSNGIAVEKIFPLNLPTITKIEIKKIAKVNRAKLYFLKRDYKKKLKETKVD